VDTCVLRSESALSALACGSEGASAKVPSSASICEIAREVLSETGAFAAGGAPPAEVRLGLGTDKAMLLSHPRSHRIVHGNAPTLVDLCKVPQVEIAERFGARIDHVPEVVLLYQYCTRFPAFAQAAPEAVNPARPK